VASLLLGYPDEGLLERVPLLRALVASLPPELARPLGRFLDHVETGPLGELQTQYVETFDLRRRSCLYLTYFTYGDTRKRGMALLQFKHLYAQAGLTLADHELPDHLAVVLEFAAAHPDTGAALLTEHRAGLELLRMSLRDLGSPWAGLVEAVTATLLPPALKSIGIYGVYLAVVFFRPRGLFGNL
jgi:nitrate reductase delta subunit